MGTRARDFSRSLGEGGGGNVTLADLFPYLTTANVTELGNLYFSNDRVFANLQLSSINDLFDVDTENYTANIGFGLVWSGNLWIPGPVTANLSTLTTDDLQEGNVNLYYTNARVRSAVGALNPTIIYDENTGLFAANLEAVAASANTTDSLPEGFVNLYYRDSRAFANLNLASLDALYDVDYLGNTPPPNSILVYNFESNVWQPAFLTSIAEAEVANIVRSLDNLTSDDLREGNVNFYLNQERFANLIANISINDLRDVDTSDIANLTVGKVLGWDGSNWVPVTANGVGGDGGGVGGSVEFAERSNIANVALFALTTGFVELAGRANVADFVEFANVSGTALVADYANTAGFAELAGRANVSQFAEIANSVSSAGVAERANIANLVLTLSNFTTDDLLEGNSLYYTNDRVEANVRDMYLDIFTDVQNTTSPSLNSVLIWDGNFWTANTLASIPNIIEAVERANVANTVLTLNNFTSDDLAEGTVNQYYSVNKLNADIQTAVTGKDFNFKNLTLSGNLTVEGEFTQFNTNVFQIYTPIVELASTISDGVGFYFAAGNTYLQYNELQEGLEVTKNFIVNGNILPSVTGVYNIGSPEFKFRSAFFGAQTVYLGNLRLSEGPGGELQIFNSETGEASPVSLSNVSATEFVTVNRITSTGAEIDGYIGGNTLQFTSGESGNVYFGVMKPAGVTEFAGIRVRKEKYDGSNTQSDVIVYTEKEGERLSNPSVEFLGDGNTIFYGDITVRGNSVTEIARISLTPNTLIISEYSNTDVAISYNQSEGIITVTKDGVYQATSILTLTEDWQDTPVNAAFIPTGTYIVQIIANDSAVGGGHTQEYYSGVMSWYSDDTNSGTADEIALHRAGAGPGNGTIFLRIQRTLSADSNDLKLQIAGTTTNSGTSSYNFKFRRLL